jgi:hypothetical protein
MPRTLVFGHGVHVARLVGQVLLDETLARVPDYDIDPTGIERPASEFQVGFTSMRLVC